MTPRSANLVLDTNLLLLWLVARSDVLLLETFKRVRVYSYADIESLRDIVRSFRGQMTTPHVLAETSNLVDQAPLYRRPALIEELRRLTGTVAEVYRPSTALMTRSEFPALGLTDTALAELSTQAVIATGDHQLSGKILALGGQTINFNQLRPSHLPRAW